MKTLKRSPHRHYALVLGTSKYVAKGKTNKYYDYRLEASKYLIDQNKVDYLLLRVITASLQYNEPRTMFLTYVKWASESVMFKDFAGFRTLDSVVRANKVFQVPPLRSSVKNSIVNVLCLLLNIMILMPFVSPRNSQKFILGRVSAKCLLA